MDISVNLSSKHGNENVVFWTVPRISYLRYFKTLKEQSIYWGGGIGRGGVLTLDFEKVRERNKLNENANLFDSNFVGVIPHIILGYEMLRDSLIFSFAELTISQPFFPFILEGPTPGPIAELSIGAGF